MTAVTLKPPAVSSLEVLAIDSLRSRSYGAELEFEQLLGHVNDDNQYQRHFSQDGSLTYSSFLTSYRSDGLRIYARVDVPAGVSPAGGFPVVVFLHGWVGIDNAPKTDFYYSPDSYYADWVHRYADAGFVVVTPGYRGHGTVNGVAAEGIEYLAAWDNGSYVCPAFYAIDVLNLLDGLGSLQRIDWRQWDQATPRALAIDLNRVNIASHSQGGDVALMVLAAAGEGSQVSTPIAAASIWAGTFPDRFAQLATYHPMQTSKEAFMSGDGSWTTSAVGADGSINPNFIFGYPSDWIGTIEVSEWTWQHDTWSAASVADALEIKARQMYDAINTYAGDINDARFEVLIDRNGKAFIEHDPRVRAVLNRIGGFDQAHYLTEPLVLQHSDRDFYSLPEWNAELCQRIDQHGSRCYNFTYPGSGHSLKHSQHDWFAPPQTVAGFDYAIRRDIALFNQQDPNQIVFP